MKTEDSAIYLEDPKTLERNEPERLSTTVLNAPLRLTGHAMSSIWDILRPYTPHVVPFIVYLSFLPLVTFLSFSAGWVIWRRIATGWEIPVYLQYGDNRSPYAHVFLPTVSTNQPYDIDLVLNVPSTPSNQALGNFMTTLIVSSMTNMTLTEVRVPSIALPPRSWLPFSPSGNTFDVQVPLLKTFLFSTSPAKMFLEVGRKDGWTSLGNGHGRELTVAAATMRGRLVHQGLRGLITRFPLTTSLISSLIFFTITMSIVGAFVLPLALSTPDSSLTEEKNQEVPQPISVEKSTERDFTSSDEEERKWERRKRSRSSRSGSRSVKVEPSSSIIPPADVPKQPLRRRRSAALAASLSDSDD